VITFWYRQSSVLFRAASFPTPTVNYDSPASSDPGMVRLRLDAKGRLIALEAQPVRNAGENSLPKPVPSGDWSALFRLADLDPALFRSTEPTTIPSSPFDARAAWRGTFEPGRTEPVRVEAAWLAGKPVYFSINGEWQTPPASPPGPNRTESGIVLDSLVAILVIGSVVLARWNLLRDRADRKGAWIVASAGFV
jgi:hypothetical protein